MDCNDCSACCKWVILKGDVSGDNEVLWRMRGAVFIGGNILIRCACRNCNPIFKRCNIYHRRPNLCKNFQVGSIECEMCRKAEGLDVELDKVD